KRKRAPSAGSAATSCRPDQMASSPKSNFGPKTPDPDLALAESLFARLLERTRDKEGVTRAAYGEGEQFAHDLVTEEARKAGLETRVDAGGNLYATLRGTGEAR